MNDQIRVIAARPWDPREYPPQTLEIWERSLRGMFDEQGLERPIIYPGSVEGHCLTCRVRVAIGPRQQEAMRDGHSWTVLCMICAAAIDPDEREVSALNNPDDPNIGKM